MPDPEKPVDDVDAVVPDETSAEAEQDALRRAGDGDGTTGGTGILTGIAGA